MIRSSSLQTNQRHALPNFVVLARGTDGLRQYCARRVVFPVASAADEKQVRYLRLGCPCFGRVPYRYCMDRVALRRDSSGRLAVTETAQHLASSHGAGCGVLRFWTLKGVATTLGRLPTRRIHEFWIAGCLSSTDRDCKSPRLLPLRGADWLGCR